MALTDPDAADQIAAGLEDFGIDATAFAASMPALMALEDAHTVEVLVTSVRFPPNTPNGVALARMARVKRPKLQVLFIDDVTLAEHTEGLGTFMASPAPVTDVLRAALRLLSAGE